VDIDITDLLINNAKPLKLCLQMRSSLAGRPRGAVSRTLPYAHDRKGSTNQLLV